MRRTLLMIAAVALLLTQCRKPAVELPTAGPANENMVSMTVTVGHGGKTDINGTTGAIKWSKNDKLYVGDGSKYIGCLTLHDASAGEATGTFSGSVSATAGSYTFGFYYLGSGDYTSSLENDPTKVDISFASQTGVLADASSCHIGYGTAMGKVEGTSVILASTDPVTMTSKVAIAYFEFKDGTPEGYSGVIELSGANICNSMTVGFNGSFAGTAGTSGNAISLTNEESSRKYVMLVPPENVVEETLNFGGGAEGTTKLYKGIEANKFYCVGAGEPIEVSVTPKPTPKFTVDKDGSGNPITVEFSPGNLYWDGSAFRFEENQWSCASTWNASYVSHFFWSKDVAEATKENFNWEQPMSTADEFFTNSSSFQVAGETAGTWRTLSKDEWGYLLNTRDNASSLRAWKELDSGEHNGLVILPDGTDASVMESITSTSHLATYSAVFLPAAGVRNGTDVVGSDGYYWSGTPGEFDAYYMLFGSGSVISGSYGRDYGYLVRLVR